MSLINNQTFITHLLRAQGCQQSTQQSEAAIQILVQLQTRKFIETIKKFTRQDKRDTAQSIDVQQALKYMGHNDINLSIHQNQSYKKDPTHSQFVRLDPIYKNPTKFIQQQIKMLNATYTIPKIKGRWIYFDGKIPKTNDNSTLRSLSDMRTIIQHQQQQKKKKFNIIRDQPLSLLTKQQQDYYSQITKQLLNTEPPSNPIILNPQGNVRSLFPFLMKFLLNIQMRDKTMQFFLNLLENKYVGAILQGNLHQIMIYLMSYAGQLSFAVGLKIGMIVKSLSYKYPTLYDIFNRDKKQLQLKVSKKLEQSEALKLYSSVLKRIAFELSCGVPLELNRQFFVRCKEEAYGKEDNLVQNIAALCLNELIKYWGQLSCSNTSRQQLQEHGIVIGQFYWCPTMIGRQFDSGYMMM